MYGNPKRQYVAVQTGNLFCFQITVITKISIVANIPCLKKANLFLALCHLNVNRYQYKLVGMSWKKPLTKLSKKWKLSLKNVLTLFWEIWSDRLSRQCKAPSEYVCNTQALNCLDVISYYSCICRWWIAARLHHVCLFGLTCHIIIYILCIYWIPTVEYWTLLLLQLLLLTWLTFLTVSSVWCRNTATCVGIVIDQT